MEPDGYDSPFMMGFWLSSQPFYKCHFAQFASFSFDMASALYVVLIAILHKSQPLLYFR